MINIMCIDIIGRHFDNSKNILHTKFIEYI